MPRRWLCLPSRGILLISTDLHGNGDDFRTLRDRFLALPDTDAAPHWAILGDAVHAPSAEARQHHPNEYDYPDESGVIVEGIATLQKQCPHRVHYVLGNHDYGHLGGPHTHRFYKDEVAHLEATLGANQLATLDRLFRDALLAIVAPCGVLLAHGSPNDFLVDLDDLNRIHFPPAPVDPYLCRVLDSFLNSYGQSGDITERLLANVSRSGTSVRMVIHGHDRDSAGYFVEGGNQLCPVLFGAPRHQKRFVQLDLAAHYASVQHLRDGHEIRRLYG